MVDLRGELRAFDPDSRQARSDLADLLRANDDYTESAAVLTQLIDAPDDKRAGGVACCC